METFPVPDKETLRRRSDASHSLLFIVGEEGGATLWVVTALVVELGRPAIDVSQRLLHIFERAFVFQRRRCERRPAGVR